MVLAIGSALSALDYSLQPQFISAKGRSLRRKASSLIQTDVAITRVIPARPL